LYATPLCSNEPFLKVSISFPASSRYLRNCGRLSNATVSASWLAPNFVKLNLDAKTAVRALAPRITGSSPNVNPISTGAERALKNILAGPSPKIALSHSYGNKLTIARAY